MENVKSKGKRLKLHHYLKKAYQRLLRTILLVQCYKLQLIRKILTLLCLLGNHDCGGGGEMIHNIFTPAPPRMAWWRNQWEAGRGGRRV